jgi:hypothetical protein
LLSFVKNGTRKTSFNRFFICAPLQHYFIVLKLRIMILFFDHSHPFYSPILFRRSKRANVNSSVRQQNLHNANPTLLFGSNEEMKIIFNDNIDFSLASTFASRRDLSYSADCAIQRLVAGLTVCNLSSKTFLTKASFNKLTKGKFTSFAWHSGTRRRLLEIVDELPLIAKRIRSLFPVDVSVFKKRISKTCDSDGIETQDRNRKKMSCV